MSTLDDREKAFEKKFAHDEEAKFRLKAKRNRLLGLWAANLLGKEADEADIYALEVVTSDLSRPDEEDVVAKIHGDFREAGLAISNGEIRTQMSELLAKVMAENEAS